MYKPVKLIDATGNRVWGVRDDNNENPPAHENFYRTKREAQEAADEFNTQAGYIKQGYSEMQENGRRIMIDKDGDWIITDLEDLAIAQGGKYAPVNDYDQVFLTRDEAENLGLEW